MSYEVGGINLGGSGDSRAPVLEAFKQMGIAPALDTVSKWRSGDGSGVDVADRIRCSQALTNGFSLAKPGVYHAIASSGVSQRTQARPPRKAVYLSSDFTEKIATELDMEPAKIRFALRAMRAEVAYPDANSSDQKAFKFNKEVLKYLADYRSLAPSHVPPKIDEFEDEWDGSLPSFYRIIYRSKARGIGAWVPYEVQFMRDYYQDQLIYMVLSKEKNERGLSEFDKYILNACYMATPVLEQAKYLKRVTGVDVDKDVISLHRNLLVYGQLTNPERAQEI